MSKVQTISFPVRKTRALRSSKTSADATDNPIVLETCDQEISNKRASAKSQSVVISPELKAKNSAKSVPVNKGNNEVGNISEKKKIKGDIVGMMANDLYAPSNGLVSSKGRRDKSASRKAVITESKENSPVKRTNRTEVVDALLSPSKRQKQAAENINILPDCSISASPTRLKSDLPNHGSPFKPTYAQDYSHVLTPQKPVQLVSVSPRVPLSPRYDLNRVVTPVKSTIVPNVGSFSNSKTSEKSLVSDRCHTPISDHKSVAARLMSPGSSRVLRSAQKIMTSEQCGSPGKVVRRNLCDSFIEGSPAKRHAQPVLALARDNGTCYQRVRQALHTAPPEQLVGREKEADTVTTFLERHVTGRRPGSLYISGAPGTGKTAVLTKAIEQLKKSNGCHVVYVNCMSTQNAQGVYNSILSSLNDHRTNLPAKQACLAIEGHVLKGKTSTVLVLDEIDSLDTRNQEVLYTIFEWPSLPGSTLVLIGIANSLDLTDRILPRLQARVNCRPQLLHFPPYTKNQIVAVIEDRFAPINGDEVFDRAAILFCARKVSSVSGDVRMAIDICRRALEAVETEARKQLVLSSLSPSKRTTLLSPSKRTALLSPSKRTALAHKKVGVAIIAKVVGEVYGSRVTAKATGSDRPAPAFPIQQTICICTLLLMLRGVGKAKEVLLGKFHESYCRVCKCNGVTQIDQSEFLSMCSLIESRGIMTLKKAKDTRSIKVSLRMDESELSAAMQDKTLMSSILEKGLC